MSTDSFLLRSLALRALLIASTAALSTSLAGCAEQPPEEAGVAHDRALDQEESVGEAPSAVDAENIALGKPTSQSSTGWGGVSSRAVDGNTSGAYLDNSITHTNDEANPWWQVDLLGVRSLSEVVLYNRTDCCSERLTNFNVLVSDDGSTWESFPYPGTAGAETHIPVSRTGRFVKVQLNDSGYLSLAEVKVIAGGDDLALGKEASQSTDDFGAVASRAVDGDLSGYWGDASMTQTQQQSQPWWQVDLGHVSSLGDVVLVNRVDCCWDRLSNFSVLVSDDGSTWQPYSYPGTAGRFTKIPVNRTGRFVKVQLNSTGVLSLVEVLVRPPPVNLAAGKSASQSSGDFEGYAPRAVDGNRSGEYLQNTITHTAYQNQPWWQVDLGEDRSLGDIVLYNRTDCCSERLSDFHVLVSSDAEHWTSFAHPGPAGAQARMTLNAAGRYVRVQLDGTSWLSLSEVEIFGGPCEPWQESMTDGACVTLTPWWPRTDLPPNSKIAIRLRSAMVEYAGSSIPWKKWLGLSGADGITLDAVDEQLAPRDLFTANTFRPAGETTFDLPWYNLQAQNGLYVGSSSGHLQALYDEPNGRAFSRGSYAYNPQSFLILGSVLWSQRQSHLQQLKAAGGHHSMCQSAFTLGTSYIAVWDNGVAPNYGCYPSGAVDFFIVE